MLEALRTHQEMEMMEVMEVRKDQKVGIFFEGTGFGERNIEDRGGLVAFKILISYRCIWMKHHASCLPGGNLC